MPNKADDLSVSTGSDADHLKITVEELQGMWEEFLDLDNDRAPGEFTKDEAALLWGITADGAYDRLEKLIRIGKVKKRKGKMNGYRASFYRKV